MSATTPGGVTLTFTVEASGEPDDLVILSASVLAEVEGGTAEPAQVERESKLRAVVRWTSDGEPRLMPVELVLPGKQHEGFELPTLSPVPARFLTALHECGRTATKESGRFALSKVQLQGTAGRIVGTDGTVALLWNGFTFPFTEDVLIPAIPAFGSKPLARSGQVSLGRTATHLVVVAGPWSVALPTDTKSRFPDVAGIVPRHAATTAGIDERDAAALLAALPGLPGADQENRPVTLDADRVVRVRARDDATGTVKELTLIRSPSAGPEALVVIDRRVLARALSLGCHTLHLTPDKPLSAYGDGFTFLAATLDSALAVVATDDATRSLTDDKFGNSIVLSPPNPARSPTMKNPETNGHGPNGGNDLPPGDPPDPLVVAEEVRVALADATAKATRLVALLKASKKEKKALASVWAGLKSLNLGIGGSP